MFVDIKRNTTFKLLSLDDNSSHYKQKTLQQMHTLLITNKLHGYRRLLILNLNPLLNDNQKRMLKVLPHY